LGHLNRVEQIESRVKNLPRIALAGNAYRGVGIPDCIHSGEEASEKVMQYLAASHQ
jgi:oxygen-dependent protoporphyrinogen oxidase